MHSPAFVRTWEAEFRELGLHGPLDFTLSADMRFVGQAFEVAVDLDPARLGSLDSRLILPERFAAAHYRLYRHGGDPGRRVEIVGSALWDSPQAGGVAGYYRTADGVARPGGSTDAHRRSHAYTARLLTAASLAAWTTLLAGPALLESYSSTIWVPPDLAGHPRCGRQHAAAEEAGMTLDPVDYAIISQALIAAAREMGAKLVRSAFSTVLREARDGSAALLDARGNTVAQAELIPMQLGTIGHIFQPCAALYPLDELQEGDFFAINDPYSGGQHLPGRVPVPSDLLRRAADRVFRFGCASSRSWRWQPGS